MATILAPPVSLKCPEDLCFSPPRPGLELLPSLGEPLDPGDGGRVLLGFPPVALSAEPLEVFRQERPDV